MATTILEFVKDLQALSAQQQAEIANKLARAQCGSWDEYNKQTGRVQGLAEMAELAYQLMKNRDLMADEGDKELGSMPTGDGGL